MTHGLTPDQPHCTTREAAERLGVSLRTVQLWVESGRLPAWKTQGGHRRVSVDAVEQLCRAQGNPPPGTGHKRILLVEDDIAMMKLYRIKLSLMLPEAQFFEAASGFDALLAIGRFQPDFLISDLRMPDLNGFALLRYLCSRPELAHLHVAAVTGMESHAIEAEGGVPARVRVFAKPVDFAALSDWLQQASDKDPVMLRDDFDYID